MGLARGGGGMSKQNFRRYEASYNHQNRCGEKESHPLKLVSKLWHAITTSPVHTSLTREARVFEQHGRALAHQLGRAVALLGVVPVAAGHPRGRVRVCGGFFRYQTAVADCQASEKQSADAILDTSLTSQAYSLGALPLSRISSSHHTQT
jgi:hypothetical protein